MTSYVSLGDSASWPNPEDPTELEWSLRHSKEPLKDHEKLVIASYMATYAALFSMTNQERNKAINAIKRELAKVKS